MLASAELDCVAKGFRKDFCFPKGFHEEKKVEKHWVREQRVYLHSPNPQLKLHDTRLPQFNVVIKVNFFQLKVVIILFLIQFRCASGMDNSGFEFPARFVPQAQCINDVIAQNSRNFLDRRLIEKVKLNLTILFYISFKIS